MCGTIGVVESLCLTCILIILRPSVTNARKEPCSVSWQQCMHVLYFNHLPYISHHLPTHMILCRYQLPVNMVDYCLIEKLIAQIPRKSLTTDHCILFLLQIMDACRIEAFYMNFTIAQCTSLLSQLVIHVRCCKYTWQA